MNALSHPAPAALDGPVPRSARRVNAFLLAFVETEGRAYPVRLRNISVSGALVEAEAGFDVGTEVTFRRAFASVPARIVWTKAGRFGLLFGRSLAEEDVAALSRRIVPGQSVPAGF